MAIKINGKDLAKRIINWQEVQKVMLNWAEIRPNEIPPVDDYLCFTANEPNCTIQLSWAFHQPRNVVELETSYDKVHWTDYTLQSIITLANVWDKVYWRNKSETPVPFSYYEMEFYNFNLPQSCYASWDVTYLLCKTWTTIVWDNDFCLLFYMNPTAWDPAPSKLITPPRLPATTLGEWCYYNMFFTCAELEALPELPATTLNRNCYMDMFRGCHKIKLSTTQTWEYQTPYRIPIAWEWTAWEFSLSGMFTGTWGTFTGTPTINQTYYTSNTIIS